ncbi:MAG: hypothetical protein J5640_01220 [Bacteroidales bacterium]|nr:hypothetical protein [Bacteroidales bacterium]
MKSLFRFAMIASAVIAAAACNKEVEAPESPASQGEKITLSACREDIASGTKSLLRDDLSVWWNTGESLSVFFGPGSAGGSKFDSQNADPAATANFDGTVETTGVDPDSDYWAVYPYSADNTSDGSSVTIVIPDQQNAVEGNFADNAFPAVAKSKSLSLSFMNVCGGLKFSVTRDDITSLTFEGKGGEPLAGTVKVEFDAEGKPTASVIDGKSAVTLTAPAGGTFESGKFYYMNLLPAAFSAGIKITMTTASAEGVLESTQNLSIKRSVLALIRNVDTYATWAAIPPAVSLKDFAVEFVKGLQVWEWTVGNVDADGVRNQGSTKGAWLNVHFIPIVGNTTGNYYNYGNNQYDYSKYTPWVLNVAGTEYSSSQAWEIAIRGLLEMCTAEGQAFLDGMTNRNKAYTLQDGMDISMIPIPETSTSNKWGANPWYEYGNLVKDGSNDITEVDINFMIKVGAWHVVRSFINNSGNTSPLGAIGNFQEFGTTSSTLNLGSYKGYISPMRELLVLMRIYKYIVDNGIDSNVYTAIKDQKFSFDLYGDTLPIKAQWLLSAANALDDKTGYAHTFGGADKYKDTGEWNGTEGYAYTTAGDGGRYVDAVKYGKGRLTYVQEDKTGMDNSDRAARSVGATGHPISTGIWYGDYWLFTLTSPRELPAGTQIHIKYIARSSTAGPKYWMGEYYDGDEWKTAPMEVIEDAYNFAIPQEKTLKDRNGDNETFSYNIAMKEDGDHNTTVESYFTLTAPTSLIQYRQRVTGLYRASNSKAITGLGNATTRIAGSAGLQDDGTYTSPLIEVVP